MNPTVVILGGTGLVGGQIIECLRRKKYRVIAPNRRREGQDDNILWLKIDFSQLENFSKQLQGDIAISCLGTTKKKAGSIEAQRMVDVNYQYRFAKIVRELGASEFHLVSSQGAQRKGPGAYLKMKYELEDLVQQLKFESLSIYRPGLLLGDRTENRPAEKFAAAILRKIPRTLFFDSFYPTSVENLALRIADGMGRASKPGLTFYESREIPLQ